MTRSSRIEQSALPSSSRPGQPAPHSRTRDIEFPHDFPVTTRILERLVAPDGTPRGAEALATLFERAEGGGILPTLYRFCQATEIGPLPESARQTWRAHRTRQTLYRHQIGQIVERLAAADLRAAVLKGAPLAMLLFGRERLRYSSDIDLLVGPEDVDRATRLLEEAGYEPVGDAPEPWGTNQRPMYHHTHRSMVELHWRIARPYVPAPPTSAWLDHTRPVALEQGEAPGLEPAWALMQLAYHFQQDQGGLKSLLDIAAWHDRWGRAIEPTRILEPMAAHRGRGVLQWPLVALDSLVDYRSPLLEAAGPVPPGVEWLTRRLTATLERYWIRLGSMTWTERRRSQQDAAGTLFNLLSQSAALLAVDDWPCHPERFVYPLVFGHHRWGRRLFDWLEEAGWVDREELYDRPLFGQ